MPLPLLLTLTALSVAPPQGQEAALLADAKDGKLDTLPLLDAALIASGVPDARLGEVRAAVDAALTPAIARAQRLSHPRARGAALLRAMHESVLRTYRELATDLDDVLTTGEYNCLSSAVLYIVATERLGGSAVGMLTKRHAFARVYVDGKPLDVEATTPGGFGVDRSQLISDELLSRIAKPGEDKAAIADDLRHAEEVPPLTLVAAIYANRSGELVRLGNTDEAATALDRAARLATGQAKDRFAQWRAGLLNKSALTLADQGRLDDARALLELALDGTTGDVRAALTQNLAGLHYRQAIALSARSDWTAAKAALEQARRLGLAGVDTDALWAQAQGKLAADGKADCGTGSAAEQTSCLLTLVHAWLTGGKGLDALAPARRAVALAPSNPRARELLFFALQEHAEAQAKRERCDDAAGIVREMRLYADAIADKRWSGAQLVLACWSAVGQRHAEASHWTEAIAAYERALLAKPDEPAARQNLAAMEFNWALALAKQRRCDEARPLLLRAARVEAVGKSAPDVLASCAADRAVEASRAGDWARAVTELRRGLADAPGHAGLTQNLGAALGNWTGLLAQQGRCDEALAQSDELKALGKGAVADKVRSRCAARR